MLKYIITIWWGRLVKEAIDKFLNYLIVEKGFSENTKLAYQNDLHQLASFVEEEAARRGTIPPWAAFDRDSMLRYLLELKERKYADTTIARKVAAIKSFYSFLVAEGMMRENPTRDVPSPRVGKSLPRPISIAQARLLLEQPSKRSTIEAKRDSTMLHLLYASGMRVSELVSLNLTDINTDDGYVRCFGKGHKERLIPIAPKATEVLKEYLTEARPRLVRGSEAQALLLNR